MLKTTLSVVLAGSILAAQQMVPGASHGGNQAVGAGDVDDDGYADFVVRLPQAWVVRSGQTGQTFGHLTPATSPTGQTGYFGLKGDLNADGFDDLAFVDQMGGSARYVSGVDGTLLFQVIGPELQGGFVAADHNGDGYDDVMVRHTVASGPSTGTNFWDVHSGRDGSLLGSFSKQYSLPLFGGSFGWCGDVNGDGYVDLLDWNISGNYVSSEIFAGPDFTTSLGLFPDVTLSLAADTNGDGVDEVLDDANQLVDVASGLVVWDLAGSAAYLVAFRSDVDGDGAHDLIGGTDALSGRTQQPWSWSGLPPTSAMANLGDIDADGRDELADFSSFWELQGGPVASYVRDRGHGGMTSTGSRPRISHRLRPRLGGNLLVDLRGAGSQSLVFLAFGSAIDLDLALSGAPGSRAYVAPMVAPWLVTDPGGLASYVLSVPTTTSLIGIQLSAQYAVVDSAANALGIVTSNALDFVVGN